MNEVNKMRTCNTIALFGSAACFIAVGFVPSDWPALAVVIMTLNYASISGSLHKTVFTSIKLLLFAS